jgi:hypothetical protein
MKTILLIDADIIAFRNAAVIEKRTIEATHNKSGNTRAFKNRTELKTFVEGKGIVYKAEDFQIKDVVQAAPFETLKKTMPATVNNLIEFTKADEIELHVGTSEKTFRDMLHLPSKYKDRDPSAKPVHLAQAKEWLVDNFPSFIARGIEADDSLTIRSYEEKKKGNRPIMVSNDKDSRQSQGIELLDPTKEERKIELMPDIGELREVKSEVKGEGIIFLAYQTLAGDPVDTYQPYELSSRKYGKKSAFKALVGLQESKSILEKVISEYKLLYPSPVEYVSVHGEKQCCNWEDFLLLYWRCAYMQRTWGDEGNFWDFANLHGLDRKDYI